MTATQDINVGHNSTNITEYYMKRKKKKKKTCLCVFSFVLHFTSGLQYFGKMWAFFFYFI